MGPLPPPELEVNSDSLIRVYGLPRSPERYVKSVLQLPIHDVRYVKNHLGTFCNRYVHDCCLVLGVPLPRENGWAMLANVMIDYMAQSNQGWQKMVWQDAVSNALYGRPTVVGLSVPFGHGHVAIVLPAQAYNEKDILVAQAGATNFYGRSIGRGFGSRLENVVYFGRP